MAVVCLVSLSSLAAKAERRVAFVVGNGAYTRVDPLPNPPIDAQAMAALLRNSGFDVVEGIDLGRDAMTAKLRDFAMMAQGAEIAVFFYAGHGIAVNGKNYLIPVDSDLKSEMDIKLGAAFDAEVTIDQTMSDAKVKIILLDACRDNPFASKVRSASRTRSVLVPSGLAEMKSGEGTMIAFATSPGQTALDGHKGENSPFTKALLANIAIPGLEIQQAMTQVRAQVNAETNKNQLPWGHTNLIGSVYLQPASAGTEANGAANANPSSTISSSVGMSPEVELEFWRSIRDSNKSEEFKAYLVKYPSGQFRSIATARIAALQTPSISGAPVPGGASPELVATSESSAATETALSLDRSDILIIQRDLTALGFDAPDSGKLTDDTRKSIARWQTARGYHKSGFLNRLQYQALLSQGASAVATRGVTPRADEKTKRRAVNTGSPRTTTQGAPQATTQGIPPAAAAFIGGVLGGAFRR